MRAVVQRVGRAQVQVGGARVGAIGRGLVVLLAVEKGDDGKALRWMAEKVAELRIFPDREGKMNLSVEEIGGEILAVSQFTLAARVRKGRRPSFAGAEEPGRARDMFEEFLDILRGRGLRVEQGRFGEMMQVELVNEGPVTIVLERGAGPDGGTTGTSAGGPG